MPAILTHHLFGEDASGLLPSDLLQSQEELLSFLLGNQGTDLFWARFRCPPRDASTCHTLARRVHRGDAVEFFLAVRDASLLLDDSDRGVGQAFLLGMGAHYLLDCMTHPLILATVHQLQDADPRLDDAGSELHALVESEIDVWMLWQKRHATVLEAPASRTLATTQRVSSIAGKIVSHAALSTYGIRLGQHEFAGALRDYRLFYQIVDSPSSSVRSALYSIEQIARNHRYSRLRAQRHATTPTDDCPSANLNHRVWHNPATNEASVASFADLFHDALLAWPVFSQRIAEGDERRLRAMTDGLNHYGEPADRV